MNQPPHQHDATCLAALPRGVQQAFAQGSLARYVLIQALGRGAMGVVAKAWDRQLQREVAIKFMLRGGDARRARFQREAEALAKVRHEGVVAIHDAGTEGGVDYLVMEFVRGRALSDELARAGALPAERVARLGLALAQALGAVHRAGLLHRDLKPENVLLREDGSPALTDFGLALDAGEEERLTRTGALVGTPHYLSPEQAAGARELTPACDVFSLGCVLATCLLGDPPFQAESMMTLLSTIVRAEPPDLRGQARDLDPELEAIVLDCLQRDPAERYSSGEALAADLASYLRGDPITASGSRAGARGPLRRRAPWLALGGALALALAAAAALALGLGRPPRPASPSPSVAPTSAPSLAPTLASRPSPTLAPELSAKLPARVELAVPQASSWVGGDWLPSGDVIGLSHEGGLFRWRARPDGRFEAPQPLPGGQRSEPSQRPEVWLVAGERGPFSGTALRLHWLDRAAEVDAQRTFYVRHYQFGPERRRAALLDWERGLLLLDLETRRELLRLPLGELRFERAGFLAPDRIWLSMGDRKRGFARGSTHGRVEFWSQRGAEWSPVAGYAYQWVPTNLLPLGGGAWLQANNLGQVFRCSSQGQLVGQLVAEDAGDAVLLRAIRGSVTQLVRVDAEHALVGSDGPSELRWFRLRDGANVKTIELSWDISAATLSPDGRRVLVGGAGGKLLVVPASP